MWFDIDFSKFSLHLLIKGFKKKPHTAFIQVLLRPLLTLHIGFKLWRQDNLYKIEHTGQVCSLRKSLNDKFDPEQRRIYIDDGELYDSIFMYTEAEEQDLELYTEAEGKDIDLYTEAETADNGLDFIVYVPVEVFDTKIYEVAAHIDFYKEGGSQYAIMIIE